MVVVQSDLVSDLFHRMVKDVLSQSGFDDLEPIVTRNDDGVGTTWAWEDSVGSNNGNMVHFRVSFEIQGDYYSSYYIEIKAEAVPHTIPNRNRAWYRERVVMKIQGKRDQTMGPLYFTEDVQENILEQIHLAWKEAFKKARKISLHLREKH